MIETRQSWRVAGFKVLHFDLCKAAKSDVDEPNFVFKECLFVRAKFF